MRFHSKNFKCSFSRDWCRDFKKFIEVRDKEETTLFEAMIKYPELGTKNGETIKSFTSLIQDLQRFFKDNSLKASILKMIDEIKYLNLLINNTKKT